MSIKMKCIKIKKKLTSKEKLKLDIMKRVSLLEELLNESCQTMINLGFTFEPVKYVDVINKICCPLGGYIYANAERFGLYPKSFSYFYDFDKRRNITHTDILDYVTDLKLLDIQGFVNGFDDIVRHKNRTIEFEELGKKFREKFMYDTNFEVYRN